MKPQSFSATPTPADAITPSWLTMAVIARNHQVICITHLPQIAAMADDHYVIEKSAMEQRTITEIYHLSDDASVGEIARLLGGVEITDAVMQNAREMKNLAQSKK